MNSGLGKSAQVIHIACIKKQQRNYKHCLIICGVNGLKWNWKVEVEKHSNESAYILGTRYKKDKEYIGSMQDRIKDLNDLIEESYLHQYETITFESLNLNKSLCNSYFLITNIETLRDDEIIDKLKELCKKGIINMIAVDEFHRCKNIRKYTEQKFIKITIRNNDSHDRYTINE